MTNQKGMKIILVTKYEITRDIIVKYEIKILMGVIFTLVKL